MPVWVQIVWGIAAPLIIGIVAWTAKTFLSIKERVMLVEKDIAAINTRCIDRIALSKVRDQDVKGLENAINRIDRNIVRIGAKAGAEDLEQFNG